MLLPPVNKAVARRLLAFVRANFITPCPDSTTAAAARELVALAVGPLLLRCRFVKALRLY
jgi:hypothetical protein